MATAGTTNTLATSKLWKVLNVSTVVSVLRALHYGRPTDPCRLKNGHEQKEKIRGLFGLATF